jgi:ATP-dependent exoDNAse (exonuclease V) alpha subunit
MGATLSDKGNPYFECGSTAEADERWQVVTPHRVLPGGVQGLNRMSHMEFRVGTIDFARACNRRQPFKAYRITPPRGPEQIVFGDKVICLRNGDLRLAGQEKQYGYVANGEVGIIIGELSFRKQNPNIWTWSFRRSPE